MLRSSRRSLSGHAGLTERIDYYDSYAARYVDIDLPGKNDDFL